VKLQPTQIVGLIAVLGFGGYLVVRIMQGQQDPDVLPSGVRISDLPSPSVPEPALPPLELSTTLPADLLNAGSQDARDDLYCSGLIYAEHLAKPGGAEQTQKQLNAILSLAQAGTGKLKAEGAATDATTAAIADAHTDKAAADYAARTPRIALDACLTRAAALAPASPN
jgi:hypothetical protein